MKYFFLFLTPVVLVACHKDFLDKKPDETLVIPKDLRSLQALIDNTFIMNENLPVLGEISTDGNYILDASWNSSTFPFKRNAYIWAEDLYEGNTAVKSNDWPYAYRTVLYANIVLQGVKDLSPSGSQIQDWNFIKGSAFFFRAMAFYALLQQYSPAYNTTDEGIGRGIPLRLSPGIDEISKRASVKESYQQVLNDLKESLTLLPVVAASKYRPTRPAAFALLARTFLTMSDYSSALQFADSCLIYENRLLDYNSLKFTETNPLPRLNEEVIFQAILPVETFVQTNTRRIDTSFYDLYAASDLRKQAFFKASTTGYTFNGSYNKSSQLFAGLATDEIYLIKAECLARLSRKEDALIYLNMLLAKRFKTPGFVPVTSATSEEALSIILQERKKELVCRGSRWTDLKRLNMDPRFEQTIRRRLNNSLYEIRPNSPRYVLSIPDEIIELSGIHQNER